MFHISDVCNSGRLVEGLEARGLRGFIYEWMYLLTVAAGCSSRRTSHTRQETVLDPWVHVSWKSKSLWHFLWCCERETVLVFLLDLWFLVALKSHASIPRHHERNVEIHQSTKLTNCTKHDVILCSCEDLVSRLMGIWMHVLTVLIMWWITQRKELSVIRLTLILSVLSPRGSNLKCPDHRCGSGHIISPGRWIALSWGTNYPLFCRAHVQMPCPEVPRV